MADGRGKTPRRLLTFKPTTIQRYIDSGLTDKEIAKKLHMTLLQWDKYKAAHKEIQDLYKPVARYGGRRGLFMLHDVQAIYNSLIDYMRDRDNKKQAYSIPSICSYLHISRDTYYKYLHENDNKQLINTENWEKIYTSIADLFKNMHELIESSLVDKAVSMNSVGAIFVLKNHYGYSDKKQLELSDDKTINVSWENVHSIASKPANECISSDNVKLSEPIDIEKDK